MKLDATELFVLEKEYMGSLAEYVQATELLRPSDPFLKAYSLISDHTILKTSPMPLLKPPSKMEPTKEFAHLW